MNREELSRKAMQLARSFAKRRFARHPDREERIADAESWAWEFSQTAGSRATPASIACYAIRRVSDDRRRHRGATVSIDHPRHRAGREDTGFSIVREYFRTGEDPALIVQVQLDLIQWLATLSVSQLTVALLYATGSGTTEIARKVKCSPGRVSQIRSDLRDLWREFQDG